MRVEFDGPLEFALARLPIPIEPDQRGGQRGVRFGQSLVQGQSLYSGGLRARHYGFGRRRAVDADQAITIGQSGIRQSVSVIEFDRLLEALDGLPERPRG